MNFREFLKENRVYFDGGMGTLLQEKGLKAGEKPEYWNITHPEVIKAIHKSYFDVGSNVVVSNTFGANTLKFSKDELCKIIESAIINAKNARDESLNNSPKFIALDIGPTGRLLKPLGDLCFEEAVSIFAETVKLGVKFGVDLILIETMNDSYETKAALLAAKENSHLPIIVSNAYGEDGKLMTGATPEAMVAMVEGMGADAIGANCSLGPDGLIPVAEKLLLNASIPVIIKPNAGLPKSQNGKTFYDVNENDFADLMEIMVKKGVRIVGGCCGTTPKYIKALADKTKNVEVLPIIQKNKTVISSYSHAVEFKDRPILIGERINPTGKKRFKEALLQNDMDYILSEGIKQQEKGVDVLDVNVGIPQIDEKDILSKTICELQAVIDLPLQIDTSNIDAMEKALRLYNGKAMINSVNGKEENMAAIFPLVKKYGGLVVALTLDENGIPDTAEERFNIAKRILQTAEKYGISKKDIIFDTLAMTISADKNSAVTTIKALNKISKELDCHTSLGVSNVSFGLPCRDSLNGVFFALCLENGLSAAIINPFSQDIMKTFYTYNALKGLDDNCSEYIENIEKYEILQAKEITNTKNQEIEYKSELQRAIIKGLRDRAVELTKELLKDIPPLTIISDHIIPALNKVGEAYENKTVYLPGLLMSAEASKGAFEEIKKSFSETDNNKALKCTFIIATVKGDIHDIGKNIVKLILNNYGFNVIDLGKDVPPQEIVEATVKYKAPLVGLSALMTTTVPSMEETIKELRKKAPWCKIVVGGAVLTEDYAKKIGADKYAKDAMESVRYAEEIYESLSK